MSDAVEGDPSPNHSKRLILCPLMTGGETRARRCLDWSTSRGNVFITESYTSPFTSSPGSSLAHVDELAVPGPECTFCHCVIGRSGWSLLLLLSAQSLNIWIFHTQLLCITALLSPPNLSHMFPGIRLIQGDISFAILITAHRWGKQSISVNEWLWDFSRHILNPIKA